NGSSRRIHEQAAQRYGTPDMSMDSKHQRRILSYHSHPDRSPCTLYSACRKHRPAREFRCRTRPSLSGLCHHISVRRHGNHNSKTALKTNTEEMIMMTILSAHLQLSLVT